MWELSLCCGSLQSHHSTPKSRPFSTLDPELMLHPEALPRASTVSMTKEYSFLRTSVPRGPKLGSLGLPPPPREKKSSSRTSRSGKIHSLADYKTPEADSGAGVSSGAVAVTASSSSGGSLGGSLQANRSASSTVSELSATSDPAAERAESSLLLGDGVSEADGSESGARLDGNDSDSSSYSGVSASAPRGFGTLAAAVGGPAALPYTVDGREIPAEALGLFPSLRDVLQAAKEERHLLELEQEREGEGEPRSRRDSFSSRSVSDSPPPLLLPSSPPPLLPHLPSSSPSLFSSSPPLPLLPSSSCPSLLLLHLPISQTFIQLSIFLLRRCLMLPLPCESNLTELLIEFWPEY